MLRTLPFVLVVAFGIWAAVDAVQTPEHEVRHLPKLAWVVLILLFPLVGGATWLIAGRQRALLLRGPGPQAAPPRPQPPRGPDDDPDFLRGL